MKELKIIVEPGGPRPPFPQVARHLWGEEDFDSDGDSPTTESSEWTELTLINRADTTKRIDIDPISLAPLRIEIRSESENLAEKVASFLEAFTKGKRIAEPDD